MSQKGTRVCHWTTKPLGVRKFLVCQRTILVIVGEELLMEGRFDGCSARGPCQPKEVKVASHGSAAQWKHMRSVAKASQYEE